MTSESGSPQGITDDRLAEARDSVLADGETVVAQEEGDQGQGIVLTNSRVLIIKVGVTATGVADGRIIGDFPLQEIAAVRLRKGPLGAVIQVCTAQSSAPSGPGAPDNVVVFTGSARLRKCEAMAARIEKVVEPAPQTSDQVSSDKLLEEVAEKSDSYEFRPNPNLPKPPKADNSGARKMLVLLGLLLAALLVGTAVTAPLRAPQKTPTVEVSVGQLTNSPSIARKQLAVVADFESRLTGILGELAPCLATIESALRSSSRAALASALRANSADRSWRRMSAIQAPPGLTGARETIVSGLFTIKGAVADLSASVESSAPLNAKQALSRIADGKALTQKGLESIDQMRADLSKQVAGQETQPR